MAPTVTRQNEAVAVEAEGSSTTDKRGYPGGYASSTDASEAISESRSETDAGESIEDAICTNAGGLMSLRLKAAQVNAVGVQQEPEVVVVDSTTKEHQPTLDELEEQKNVDERVHKLFATFGTAAQLINAFAKVIDCLISDEQIPVSVTPFHSSRVPSISILGYLTRIHTYAHCSDACLLLALVYIDRLAKMQPDFVLTRANAHRLIAVSIVVGAKTHDDIFYSNSYYAKIAGLSPFELNKLEALFLRLISWRTNVKPDEFEQYLLGLMPIAATNTDFE
jgi:hypothetical protein